MIKTIIGAYNQIEDAIREQILTLIENGENVLLENIYETQLVLLKGDMNYGEDNSLWISFKEGRTKPTVYTTVDAFLKTNSIVKVLGTVESIEFT